MKLIKFRFTTPLHIGTVRADTDTSESTIHSDTLYSSIIMAWSKLGIQHPMMRNRRVEDPIHDTEFTLTSMFPYYQKVDKQGNTIGESLLFFPRPIGTIKSGAYKTHKQFKAIKYLDLQHFKELLKTGNIDAKKLETNIHGDYLTNNEDIKAMKKEKEDFMERSVSPRVYVPRNGEKDDKGNPIEDTEIFYMERIYFRGKSGFFCLVNFDDETIEKKVTAALNYLQDEGIGSDRNTGNGAFEYTIEPFSELDDIIKMKTEYRTSMSLFCPEKADILQDMIGDDRTSKATYELVKRGGWMTTTPHLNFRKNSIYMMNVGSILKTGEKTAGKTVDLRPDVLSPSHSVYRVGKSLFLPINI